MKDKLLMRMSLATTLFVVATVSHANSDWEWVGKNAEYAVFISPSSIKTVQKNARSPIYQQAWFKMHIQNDISKDGLRVGDYKLRLYQFDCAQQTVGLVYSVDQNKKDNQTITQQAKTMDMKPAVPESMGQAFMDIICSGKYPTQS